MNRVRVNTALENYLPTWYRNIADYRQIVSAESETVEQVLSAMTEVHGNFYVSSMNEAALEEWESVFGIVPNPDTESLDFRRSRILNRIGLRPPFTVRFLEQKLNELIGEGEFTIYVDSQNYTLIVESAADNQQWEIEVAYTVNQIKPAHIVFINRPYLRDGILLSEAISTSQRVYNYRLGSWGLGLQPFANLEEMGVIKMSATPSLQDYLLEGVSNYVSADIVSARINGNIAISAITKTVTNNTVTVTYDVLPADTDAITKAELLDASGNVLSSATIYVPVTQPTIMKHVIPVKEGVIENGG